MVSLTWPAAVLQPLPALGFPWGARWQRRLGLGLEVQGLGSVVFSRGLSGGAGTGWAWEPVSGPGPRAWDPTQLRWCRCLLRGWGLLVARQCQDLGPACLFLRSSISPERAALCQVSF